MSPAKLVIERFQFKEDLSEIYHSMDNPQWINIKCFFSCLLKKSVLYVSTLCLTEKQYNLVVKNKCCGVSC